MKTKMSKILCAMVLLFSTTTSQAIIMLEFDPVMQEVAVGDSVDVGVVISGLRDFAPVSLGDFDLDVTFDDSILSFDSLAFGSFLGDPFLGDAITGVDDSVSGVVNLFEVSLLEPDGVICILCIPPFLDDLQPGSFTLATLTFEALAAGTSSLLLNINALGDAFGDPLSADLGVGSITAVPEPATLILLSLGLIALVGLRRIDRRA